MNLGDILLAFLSLMMEGLPFILIGAVISGCLEFLLPSGTLQRWLPKSKWKGCGAALLFAFALPVCECGALPVVKRLIRKGVSPSVATTYLLAAPALNPLVWWTTYLAFQNRHPWQMLSLRFSFTLLLVLVITTWLTFLRPEKILKAEFLIGFGTIRPKRLNADSSASLAAQEQTKGGGAGLLMARPSIGWSLGGLQSMTGAIVGDLMGVMPYLVLGASVAALFSTGFPRQWLAPAGENLALGPMAGVFLAQILCLCSSTDAFIGAALSSFSDSAKLAFLVAGPILDWKLYGLYRSVYQPHFLRRLALIVFCSTFALTFGYGILTHSR